MPQRQQLLNEAAQALALPFLPTFLSISVANYTTPQEYDAFPEWLELTGQRQILDGFSNFLWAEHQVGRYPYPPQGR